MANPKIEVEIGAKTSEFQRKFGEVDSKLKQTGKEFSVFGQFAKGALLGIASAVSVQAIIGIGKAVLETTAEFQKFEAVLTNTLGSNSAAQLALIQIQDFASKTPFSVSELTESFVKLANQGFKPTVAELTSLGDLASSTGKSFDQLAEAILDASTGEFERLKEFGIRAKKEGDNVTFTFKGVETQVKSTDSEIRAYILSLGEAEGVSGSMAAISETLGGKLSNLGDNVDQLKLAIGDQTSGVFAASIDWLNEFIEVATLAAKKVSDIKKEVKSSGDAQIFSETRKEVDFLVAKLSETLPVQEAINRAVELTKKSYKDLSDDISKGFISGGSLSKQLQEIEDYRLELLKAQEPAEILTKNLGLIGGLTAQINTLNEQRDIVKDQDEVNIITAKVSALKDQLALINAIAKRASEPVKSEVAVLGPRDNPFAGGMPTPVITQGVQTDPTAQILESMRAGREVLANSYAEMKAQAEQFNQDISDIINNGVANTLGNFAFSIGDALASGGDVLKAAGASLLDGLASVLNQLGQLAIATGIGIKGIKTALKTLNPAVAIGAGVALVALAGFVSSKAKSLGGGPSVSSGGGGGSVGSGVSGQSFTGTGLNAMQSMNIGGEFTVKGSDLVFVLSQEEKKRKNG